MGLEVIRKVYKRKSEEREILRKRVLKDVFKALENLRDEVSFEEAYIFGSVTEPYRFGEHSDIDFAFIGLDRDKLFFAAAFLSRYLNRDANVMHLGQIHFKDKILRSGIKWKRD